MNGRSGKGGVSAGGEYVEMMVAHFDLLCVENLKVVGPSVFVGCAAGIVFVLCLPLWGGSCVTSMELMIHSIGFVAIHGMLSKGSQDVAASVFRWLLYGDLITSAIGPCRSLIPPGSP